MISPHMPQFGQLTIREDEIRKYIAKDTKSYNDNSDAHKQVKQDTEDFIQRLKQAAKEQEANIQLLKALTGYDVSVGLSIAGGGNTGKDKYAMKNNAKEYWVEYEPAKTEKIIENGKEKEIERRFLFLRESGVIKTVRPKVLYMMDPLHMLKEVMLGVAKHVRSDIQHTQAMDPDAALAALKQMPKGQIPPGAEMWIEMMKQEQARSGKKPGQSKEKLPLLDQFIQTLESSN